MKQQPETLATRVRTIAARHGPRPALMVAGRRYSYADLLGTAGLLACAIRQAAGVDSPFVGVLAHGSLTAYSGILGTVLAGRTYLPLHPHHPVERTQRALAIAGAGVLVAGEESRACLEQLLASSPVAHTVILPWPAPVSDLARRFPRHRFLGEDALREVQAADPGAESAVSAFAYLIFTSGSTGVPKGVPVTHDNVLAYLDNVRGLFLPTPEDRYYQGADLTFDLSVHPVWICWTTGGCLCVAPDDVRMAPGKYIRDQEITVWTSVPSVIMMLSRMRLLKPGAYPGIRYSMFCGEPLPEASVVRWQEACPNSVVDNYYGPTEATVAITHYRWNPATSRGDCRNGVVPLGHPFPGQTTTLVDQNLRPVLHGQPGELCLAGSQVTTGYLRDDALTREKYVILPEAPGTCYYRTGDVACEVGPGGLHFLGRVDFQVKIRGHRIELAEVEGAVRAATDAEMVVCLAWPPQQPTGLVACVGGGAPDVQEPRVIERCRRSLPEYMVPHAVRFFPTLPLNANGKVDRRRLEEMIQPDVRSL